MRRIRIPGAAAPRRARAVTLAASLALAVSPFTVLTAQPAAAQANGVAASPPMGWSSWSFIRSNPTEADIEAQAAALASSGLLAHGYSYVNIDDFWYLNPKTSVDSYGRWVTDSGRFPSPTGMKAVGDYVHGLGEKFGMYLTPGIPVAAYNQNTPIEGTSFHARDIVSDTTRYETNYNFGNGSMYYIDYARNPAAAQAFLNSWADQLASYGMDYLKIDGVGSWDIPDVQHWSQALNQTGRPIHLELSNSLDINNAATWQQYSNGWRAEGDIECYCSSNSSYPLTSWNHVASRFTDSAKWAKYAGPGGWNDLDSVEVGNGSDDGLTPDERQTQLTLWAASAAPLLLGTDLTRLDAGDTALLTNDEVLAVDRAGHPARPVDQLTQQQVWSAPNPDGSYTVALFNLSSSAATVTARWSDLGFTGSAALRDLWSHTDLPAAAGTFSATLPSHGSRLLHVTPAAGAHYTALHYNLVNAASGQYLDVAGAATTDGAGLVQQPANGGADQQWQLIPTGDGHYKIVNVNSSALATVPGANTTSGSQLVQNHDDAKADSQWTLAPTGNGAYTIVARSDGQLIDTSGSAVVQAAASGGAGQQWRLVPVPVPGARYKLVNGNSGGRMDVNGDSTADAATILQWQDNQQADQLWTFAAQSGGAYTIANVNSGKLLNIPGPTTGQGTQLIQFHDDGNSNSRWQLVDAGPNQLQLRSVYDGQLIDVSNGSLANGGSVIQWNANGGSNQLWSVVSTS